MGWKAMFGGGGMSQTLLGDRPRDNPCAVCGKPSFYLVHKMFKGDKYVCQEHVLEA